MYKRNKKEFVLSCGGKYWCPVIKFENEKIFIEDDFGSKVEISRKAWTYLVKSIRNGKLG